jgi:predicted esterase
MDGSQKLRRVVMKKTLLVIISMISLASTANSGDSWRSDLDKLIASSSIFERDSLISEIAKQNPSWQQIQTALKAMTFPSVEPGNFFPGKTICIDNVERPYVIYVPSGYSPEKQAPLVVYLHGSVSRADIENDPAGWAKRNPFVKIAEEEGWILLFPFGQAGATWWDEVGISNILNLIRVAKIQYNIDDNRVFLGGFSDGASGAYLFAMALPGDFAGFIALNGNMGVASEDGGLPTYASNFTNSQVYAVSTDKDQLYPTAETERFIALAQSAGANIEYRKLKGEHSFAYADSELPYIADWMYKQIRNPFPTKLFWESALPGFGVCRWFAIDEIAADEPASWYHDYNTAFTDSSVAIGIVIDEQYSGMGVRVSNIADGDYLARRIGLKGGDIIVKGGNMIINNSDDLAAFKRTLHRGDPVSLAINRAGAELILRGRMPPLKNYFLFKRDQPSAAARVLYGDNKVKIESSRLGAFKIFVSPEMFNLEKNIVVYADGNEVFNASVAPDISYMLHDFMLNRDRNVLYVNEIAIRLK